jgi:hypothetical protein
MQVWTLGLIVTLLRPPHTDDPNEAVAQLALRQMYIQRHKFGQYINGVLTYIFTSVWHFVIAIESLHARRSLGMHKMRLI